MSIFKSRRLPGKLHHFDTLQLGASITYAEGVLRKTLQCTFGEGVTVVSREIITPVKKDRPKALPWDPCGVLLKGELALDVQSKYEGKLTHKQRCAIDKAEYDRYRKMQDDDFQDRTVFFRALVRLGESQESPARIVIVKVVAHALSNWWHRAESKIWHCPHEENCKSEPVYQYAEYLFDGSVYKIPRDKTLQPPKIISTFRVA